MKGYCEYCKKEIDETEYMQNSGMCVSCFEDFFKRLRTSEDSSNAVLQSSHISEHSLKI